MEQRSCAGYVITQSIKVKDTEFVLEEHPKTGMCVTWQCKNGDNYFWGHYCPNKYDALPTFAREQHKKWIIWHPLVLSLRCHPEKQEIGGMNDDADTRILPLGRSPELQDSLSRCVLRQYRQSWRCYGSRKHCKRCSICRSQKALFSGCWILLF